MVTFGWVFEMVLHRFEEEDEDCEDDCDCEDCEDEE
jgi:hypothetical protein